MRTSDEQLMRASAEGDMDAFETLVRRHQSSALNLAYRFLSQKDTAEDIAQEAFLRILEHASSYIPTAKFTTYLYSVVTRLCIDWHRKHRPALSEPHQQDRTAESQSPGPEAALQQREEITLIREAIDALPPRQRAALALQFYQGLSYAEIAEALNCSRKAVSSLLVRAKRTLAERLGPPLQRGQL